MLSRGQWSWGDGLPRFAMAPRVWVHFGLAPQMRSWTSKLFVAPRVGVIDSHALVWPIELG